MRALLHRLVVEERGQDLIEYALLTAAIGFAALAAWATVEDAIEFAYGEYEREVNNIWETPNPSGS